MVLRLIKKRTPLLLCPGPVLLSKKVRKAVIATNIGHREPEFSAILSECSQMIKPIVGISGKSTAYEVAFITGSGTAANETVLSSVGARGHILVVSNGEFGERLFDVAKLHNNQVDQLKFKWQEKIDLTKVAHALKLKKYSLVAMVHHETSTGLLNPVKEVAALAHKHGALISVDAISSIGAEAIEVKKWGVDILVGASGKALSAMPGVGILIAKKDVINKLKGFANRIHYLDLYKHIVYMRDYTQTPNTPAVHVFVSLHASLKEITHFGVMKFRQNIQKRAQYVRDELLRLGLVYTNYEGSNSRVITCVNLPSHLSFSQLSSFLKKKGIIVYNGKGVLKDRIFQIGHIGALKTKDTKYAMKQIAKVVKQSEVRKTAHELSALASERVVHGV